MSIRSKMSLLVLLGFSVWGSGAVAACLPGRTISAGATAAGIGTLGGYPALPLKAGEYVLTFDDGPNPATTPQILDALRTYCVKATFFMLGKSAANSPDMAKRVMQEGHVIASHSLSHPNLTQIDPAVARSQIDRGRLYVARNVGMKPPVLFRYPNNVSNPMLDAYVRSQGMVIVSYDLSPQDWRNEPAEVTFARLKTLMQKQDRGIIVLHDIMPNTARMVPMLLQYMAERRLSTVQLKE